MNGTCSRRANKFSMSYDVTLPTQNLFIVGYGPSFQSQGNIDEVAVAELPAIF